MTDLVSDRFDSRLVRGATGLLAIFNEAGVLDASDVHVAVRLGRLAGNVDDEILLAVALAVRAPASAMYEPTSPASPRPPMPTWTCPSTWPLCHGRNPPRGWRGLRPATWWVPAGRCVWRAPRSTSTATGPRRSRSPPTSSLGAASWSTASMRPRWPRDWIGSSQPTGWTAPAATGAIVRLVPVGGVTEGTASGGVGRLFPVDEGADTTPGRAVPLRLFAVEDVEAHHPMANRANPSATTSRSAKTNRTGNG